MANLRWQRFVLTAFFSTVALSAQAFGFNTTPHLLVSTGSSAKLCSEWTASSWGKMSATCSSITIDIVTPKTITVNSVPDARITIIPGTGIPGNVSYTTTCSESVLQSSCTITFTAHVDPSDSSINIVGSNAGGSTALPFNIYVRA